MLIPTLLDSRIPHITQTCEKESNKYLYTQIIPNKYLYFKDNVVKSDEMI